MDEEWYTTRAFARLAGVTARTLHFYDEAGLLVPEREPVTGHRCYRPANLLRLQQVLTLKHLGFSLDAIRTLLDSSAYDVADSLRIQHAALTEEMARLGRASEALARVLATLEAEDELDWTQVVAIIRGVQQEALGEWVARAYSDEGRARVTALHAATTPESIHASQREWEQLLAAFRRVQRRPPEHPSVQRLAARAQTLLDAFTQGDPEVIASLQRFYHDFDQVPADVRHFEPELQRFIGQALTVYNEKAQQEGKL